MIKIIGENESIKESDPTFSYRYLVMSTLRADEREDGDIVDTLSGRELAPYKDCINDAIGDVDLAEYLDEPLSSSIKSIKMCVDTLTSDGRLVGMAEVTADHSLSEQEKSELMDYLSGQYSDGWGEGFEQQEVNQHMEEIEDDDNEDPETGEYYTDYRDVSDYLSIHFWQSEGFKIWIQDLGKRRSVSEGAPSDCCTESEELNFNKLAWDSPNHDGEYGYLPTDKYYDEIVAWLKTGTKRWETTSNGVTTVRMSVPNSVYDVIVNYNHKTKMISWIFRKQGVYQI
jgi:hypothetical protein